MNPLLSKVLTPQQQKSWRARQEKGLKPTADEVVDVLQKLVEQHHTLALKRLAKDDTDAQWEYRIIKHKTEYQIYNDLHNLLEELL